MNVAQGKRVSVIIPTYRRDWELKRALQSLARQMFDRFEIIVVDDNYESAWKTIVDQILVQVNEEFPQLCVRHIRNGRQLGSAESRNVGVRAAAGEYITFLDDDDEYLPEKLSRQYAFMEEKGLDYSITDLTLYHENGELAEHRNRQYIKETDPESLLTYHFMYHMTGTDTIMMRRSYFEAIGGFPPIDLGDEFYLMQRAIEHGGAFGYLEGCDVRAYVHTGEGGLSSGEGKIIGENRLYAHKKKYLHLLSAKSIRYIRMRHYAVLSYVGLRLGQPGVFLTNGFRGFLSAPVQCVKMLLEYKKNRAEEIRSKVPVGETA